MDRPASSSERVFESLTSFRKKWPKAGWSWDNRLSCAASSFHVELMDDAHAVAAEAMPFKWTMRNIANAPSLVRDVAESTGGIRPDQLLFSTEPSARLIAYGLWWPWGDDITISLRVGLTGYFTEADSQRFRALFGVLE
jgi:hypothetical protein